MSALPTVRSGLARNLVDRWRTPAFERRALVVSKLLDAATTTVGLLFVPTIVERNPLLRALVEVVGVVPGVVLGSVAAIALVVVVTELGVRAAAGLDPDAAWGPPTVRFVGYAPPTIVFAAAGIHNLLVVATALPG